VGHGSIKLDHSELHLSSGFESTTIQLILSYSTCLCKF